MYLYPEPAFEKKATYHKANIQIGKLITTQALRATTVDIISIF